MCLHSYQDQGRVFRTGYRHVYLSLPTTRFVLTAFSCELPHYLLSFSSHVYSSSSFFFTTSSSYPGGMNSSLRLRLFLVIVPFSPYFLRLDNISERLCRSFRAFLCAFREPKQLRRMSYCLLHSISTIAIYLSSKEKAQLSLGVSLLLLPLLLLFLPVFLPVEKEI